MAVSSFIWGYEFGHYIYALTLGWLRLEGESMGLSRLDFVEGPSSDTINEESLQRAIEQLNEYFEGTRKEFKLYLSPSGTHFLKNV